MLQRVLVVFQVLLAVIYSSAGISKLIHWFPNIIGPVWLIDELAKYNLGLFGYFIAISQAIVGTLLFFPRFRLLASLMLLPMHLCVTVVPISLGWRGTPFVNLALLLMLVALLYNERDRLKLLVAVDGNRSRINSSALYWSAFGVLWALTFYMKYGFAGLRA
jgi:hypothetical protein